MHILRKKLVIGLLVLLLVFAAVFFVGLANFSRNLPTLALGIPVGIENSLIMLLSLASMVKVIWELVMLEEQREGKEGFSGIKTSDSSQV